jgi:hypothetical protein
VVPPSTVAVIGLKKLRRFLARSDDGFTDGFGEIKGAYKRVERAV